VIGVIIRSLVVDEDVRSLGFKCSSRAGAVSLSVLLRTNDIGNGSCLLLRRDALDRAGWFDPTIAALDIDVLLRVASLRPRNVVAIPEVLIFYRRRMESAYPQVLERLRRITPREVHREENRGRVDRYRYYARLAREAGETGTAVRLMGAVRWGQRLLGPRFS
jgi:hypothetical protein